MNYKHDTHALVHLDLSRVRRMLCYAGV